MDPVWIQVFEIIIAILGLIEAAFLNIHVIRPFYLQDSKNLDQLISIFVDPSAFLGM